MFIDLRERGKEGDKEREQCERETSICTQTGDQTHNLGKHPDWDLKLQTFWCMGLPFNQLSNPTRAIV